VKFIFATTEPQKILATIVSRCQRFDLRRIAVPAIVERLRLIADSDKVKISDDALLAIARGAEGGLRDAESALDQLISFKGSQIEEADVLSVFGLVSRRLLEETAQQVLTGDIKGLIEAVAGIDEAGKDMQRFAVELMEHFRNLLICTHVDNPARSMELTEAQVETLKKQAALATMENLLRIIGVFTDTEERMRFALSRRTLMETALIRCARTATVVSLETILAEINKLKAGGVLEAPPVPGPEKKGSLAPSPAGVEASAPDVHRVASGPSSTDARGGRPDADTQGRSNAGAGTGPLRSTVAPSAGADDLKRLQDNWAQVMEKAGKTSIKAKRLLIDARPIAVDGDKVVIGLDAEFADEIQEIKGGLREREALESGLHSVLLRKVTFELREADMASLPREPPDGQPGRRPEPESPTPAAADVARKPGAKTRKDLIEDPMVQKTLEAFSGSITEVRS
jgi:DNA polymerase-3 subunit gamma/tau